MLLNSWRAFDALAPVNKMLPATSKFPAGSLEVNGWLPQLYSIPKASQEDNMRTNVPSLLWIITLHCSWQLLHDDNNSLSQLSYTMYSLSRWTTSSWWSVISLKNIHNLSNYLSRYLGSNWECLFIIIPEPEIGLERKQLLLLKFGISHCKLIWWVSVNYACHGKYHLNHLENFQV